MKRNQLLVLSTLILVAIVAVFFVEPIPQDQEYHNFADKRTCFFVPNFWNVLSNLPFVILGIIGFFKIQKNLKNYELKSNYFWFYIGIFLTGFGSAYYHYNPNDSTLIWDRLPMTISFMSFFSLIIGEFINLSIGRKLLYPFLMIGFASINYWVIQNDLRFYILIQFLPIFLIPIIVVMSKHNALFKKYFYGIILVYFIAKILENKDYLVFEFTKLTISGHTLKHIAAAIAPFIFYRFIIIKFSNFQVNDKRIYFRRSSFID